MLVVRQSSYHLRSLWRHSKIKIQGDVIQILFEAMKNCLYDMDVAIKFRNIVDMLTF